MSNESDTPLSQQDPVETWNGLKSRLSSTGRSTRYEITESGDTDKTPSKGSYNANDTALNRPVFLKKLDADEQLDKPQRDRFLKEARLTGQLQHPNIIPVHDLLKGPDGSLLFTLRYIEGQTLKDMIESVNDATSLEDTLGKILNVCDAVAYAHQNKITHNALALDTIIMGPFGEVFVLNWEHATDVESEPSVYRNDLHAVGHIIKTSVHRICRTQNRDIPLSLAAVITGATGQGRMAYSSMDELGAEIRRYLAGEPTLAEEASPIRQFSLLLLRRKLEAGALIAFLILAAGLTLWFLHNIQKQHDRKVTAAAVAKQAQRSAEESSRKEEEHVQQLQALVPLLKAQITEYIATGRPLAALSHTELTLGLAPKDADLWETYGDILQTLFRFEESLVAYQSARNFGDKPAQLNSKVGLSERFVEMLNVNSGRITDNIEMILCQELKRSGRQFEANLFLTDIQSRQKSALDEITQGLKAEGGWYTIDPDTQLRMSYTLGAGDCQVTVSDPSAKHTALTPILSIPFAQLTCQSWPALQSLEGLETHPLMKLTVGNCNIDDLSPLSALPLEYLELESPNLTSLSPLAGLPLRTLKIIHSRISDLEPLAELPLTRLDLSGSVNIANLAPMRSLALEELNLADTAIEIVDPIPIQALTHLNIAGTKVTDLSSLKGGALEELNISRTPCTSIKPLISQPIKSLFMSHSQVSSLEGLQESALRELKAEGCPITSLDPLKSLTTLRTLNISNSPVTALPPNSWSNLRVLNLDGTKIKDLTPLKGCPIRDLSLKHTPVTNISPIVHRMLYKLDLAHTNVSDLTPLINSNVKVLNLAHTPIVDISVLKGVCLSTLDISHTTITSLKGLEHIPLESLNISNTQAEDLSPLKTIPLKEIYLSSDTIRNGCEVLALIRTLQTIHFEGKTYTKETFPHFSAGGKEQ